MKELYVLLLITALLGCEGCGSWGGGGGKYYPPQVSVNNIGLIKRALSESDITSYETVFVFKDDHDEWVADRKRAAAESLQILGKRFYNICKCQYLNEKYLVALDSNAIIFDQNNDEITRLDLPRYPIQCFAFSLNLGGKGYLVIYIDQQATSHSSTLLVLDDSFNVQYKEHLLGAKGGCYGSSEKYGNYFVIKSEDFWFPRGHEVENPEVNINGDWLYYLKPESPRVAH